MANRTRWISALAGCLLLAAAVTAQTPLPASAPAFPAGVISASGITHTFLAHSPVQGKVYRIAAQRRYRRGVHVWERRAKIAGSCPMAICWPATVAACARLTPPPAPSPGNTRLVPASKSIPASRCRATASSSASAAPNACFEINRDLTIAHEIRLESTQNTHHQFRLARKTAAGTYLVAYGSDGIVRELDAEGKNARRPSSCLRLKITA